MNHDVKNHVTHYQLHNVLSMNILITNVNYWKKNLINLCLINQYHIHRLAKDSIFGNF